jgi:ribosomal protein S27E
VSLNRVVCLFRGHVLVDQTIFGRASMSSTRCERCGKLWVWRHA